MKPREVFRYTSPDQGTIDGAVFYFSQTDRTDPELLLLIEADDAGGWRYACAPLSCWSMRVMLDGKPALSIPSRYLKSQPGDTYHIWRWERTTP
jgi:hypothetical protein